MIVALWHKRVATQERGGVGMVRGNAMVRSGFGWGLVVLAVALATPAAAKRVALVIGNSDYAHAGRLTNPAADAKLIGQTLEEAGFDNVETRLDLGLNDLERALRDFGVRAEGAEVALVYFAGHGIEAGGQNYLIPVDAKLDRDRDLEIEATRLETALYMVAGGQMKIIILDACRNNPFAGSMQRTFKNRSIGRGLAAIEPEGETLVVYAAKAGATAADGGGTNSPFAEALSEQLPEAGLEISLLFRRVRDQVLNMTGGYQEPFTYGSLSGDAFYFVPPETTTAAATNAAVAGPSMDAATGEALFWQGTVNANTEAAYQSYLREYPTGRFAELAEQNIKRINAPAPAVPGLGLSLGNFQSVINPRAGSEAARLQTSAEVLRQFAFTPSAERRAANTQTFITQVSESNAEFGATLDTVFTQQDMFALIQQSALDKYGMSVNNFADAITMFIYAMHDAANGQLTDATPEQATGLRNQVAKLLLLTPGQVPTDPAKLQELSDIAILSAVMSSLMLDAGQSDPAVMQQISDAFHQQAVLTMQTDFRQLIITDQGLTPKPVAP
ncbi:MAG: caspase family protein [Pseudomonadota bacterium]